MYVKIDTAEKIGWIVFLLGNCTFLFFSQYPRRSSRHAFCAMAVLRPLASVVRKPPSADLFLDSVALKQSKILIILYNLSSRVPVATIMSSMYHKVIDSGGRGIGLFLMVTSLGLFSPKLKQKCISVVFVFTKTMTVAHLVMQLSCPGPGSGPILDCVSQLYHKSSSVAFSHVAQRLRVDSFRVSVGYTSLALHAKVSTFTEAVSV